MSIFTIDQDNNITFASGAEARSNAGTERFRSAKDLAKLAANWPGSRLIEIWNSLPGVRPVQKFTSRQTAVKPDLGGYPESWSEQGHIGGEYGAQAGAAGQTYPRKFRSPRTGVKKPQCLTY